MLFQRDFGVINWLLSLSGSTRSTGTPTLGSWTAIATMVDWRWTGYNTLILLAGMQAIPRDLYEAAAIDGASQWRQFWRITLPMLRPTFLFVVIISTIGGLQLFTEPLSSTTATVIGGTSARPRRWRCTCRSWLENLNTRRLRRRGRLALFLMIIIVSLINFLLVRSTVK